ncbi:MAG: MFS transporter [Bryobacteraceae bacterium]
METRNRSLWLHPAMLAIVALSVLPALPYNWLPVLFNVFEREFGANLEQQGSTQQYMLIAGLTMVLAGGTMTERLGVRRSAFLGLILCGAGLLATSLSPTFSVLQAAGFVYGIGIAWMYLIYGVLVSRSFPDQRQKAFLINNMVLSLLGGAGPALLGWWIASGYPWRNAYAGIGVFHLLFAIRVATRFREPAPVRPAEAVRDAGTRHPIFDPAIWLVGFCYVLHGLAEIGAISWAGKLYHLRLGIPEARMALFISANIASFALGRFLLTFLAGRFPDRVLLGLCAAGGTVCFSLVLLTDNYHLGLLAMAGSGVFMSGNHPAMSSYLGTRFSARLPHAFAVYQGFGAIGSAAAARLIGAAGDRLGLETAVWLIPSSSGLLALTAFGWVLLDRGPTAVMSESVHRPVEGKP